MSRGEFWKAERSAQTPSSDPPGSGRSFETHSMDCDHGCPKRRTFHWSNEARRFVADHRPRIEKFGNHRRGDKEQMLLRLAEISGNPRDACLRFLRRFGVADKRSYREWTTREQQRLIELMDDVPVEEAARVLRRPPASVRSMLHRLASAFARAGNGSRYLFWPKPCTLAVTRCASGLIEAGSSAALFRRRASECKLSTRTISVLSSRTMAVR